MHALARNTDPHSSHDAARELVSSGRQVMQQQLAIDAVSNWPGSTSMEIHFYTGIDRHMLGRRLPECAREGAIVRGPLRKCDVSGRLAVTWLPVMPVKAAA